MFMTDEAESKICPFIKGSKDWLPGPCGSDSCMMWRWVPLKTNEPGWKEALQTLVSEGMSNKEASAAMLTLEVKERFGLPLRPYLGYCGLAGKPEG